MVDSSPLPDSDESRSATAADAKPESSGSAQREILNAAGSTAAVLPPIVPAVATLSTEKQIIVPKLNAVLLPVGADDLVSAADDNDLSSSALRILSPSSHSYGTLSNPYGLRLQTNDNQIAGVQRSNSRSRQVSQMTNSSSFADSLSPASRPGSPRLFYTEVTPLPSPLIGSESPGPWRLFNKTSRPPSRASSLSKNLENSESVLVTTSGELLSTALAHHSKRKALANNNTAAAELLPLQNAQAHPIAGDDSAQPTSATSQLERPQFLSAFSTPRIPALTPVDENIDARKFNEGIEGPRLKREEFWPLRNKKSTASLNSNASSTCRGRAASVGTITIQDVDHHIQKLHLEQFEAKALPENETRTWRGIKQLGKGTFSRVVLATTEEAADIANGHDTSPKFDLEKLAAVKVVEHKAAGGASRSRVESSLKREMEIIKSIRHPSIIHLIGYSIEPSRALLIMPYCPGGDLFDLVSTRRELLSPGLIQRIMAELVGALCFLHQNCIIHRDVKLENVLLNLTTAEIHDIEYPTMFPGAIITLSDLGLSKRFNPESPLQSLRCGSEDYAAPEIIMSQDYDGRKTDAWALGVLLYAILEGKLPFDPPPDTPEERIRGRVAHKIARCEWRWVKMLPKESNSISEASEYEQLSGGKPIVEGFLKRANKRMTLVEATNDPWIQGGLEVDLMQHAEASGHKHPADGFESSEE